MKTLEKRRAPRHKGLTPTERRLRELVALHEAGELDDRHRGEALYRLIRLATRPFRRAFSGDYRTYARLERDAQLRYERDARAIRDCVILGARTVHAISSRTGLSRPRVRAIVQAEGIQAVRV